MGGDCTSSGGGVFGHAAEMDVPTIIYSIACIIAFTYTFEFVTHKAEVMLHDTPYNEMLSKVYKEMMIMGVLSFGIFMAVQAGGFQNTTLLHAFEFAHILIFFIAICFVLQALMMMALCHIIKGIYTDSAAVTWEELDEQYQRWKNQWVFKFRWLPLCPTRSRLEFRLLHAYFRRQYQLPADFEFAAYARACLDHHILGLIEVHTSTWIFVVALAFAFLGFYETADHSCSYEDSDDDDYYSTYSSTSSHTLSDSSHHRRLGGSSSSSAGEACVVDGLATFTALGWLLLAAACAYYLAARWSEKRLVDRAGVASAEDYGPALRQMVDEARREAQVEASRKLRLGSMAGGAIEAQNLKKLEQLKSNAENLMETLAKHRLERNNVVRQFLSGFSSAGASSHRRHGGLSGHGGSDRGSEEGEAVGGVASPRVVEALRGRLAAARAELRRAGGGGGEEGGGGAAAGHGILNGMASKISQRTRLRSKSKDGGNSHGPRRSFTSASTAIQALNNQDESKLGRLESNGSSLCSSGDSKAEEELIKTSPKSDKKCNIKEPPMLGGESNASLDTLVLPSRSSNGSSLATLARFPRSLPKLDIPPAALILNDSQDTKMTDNSTSQQNGGAASKTEAHGWAEEGEEEGAWGPRGGEAPEEGEGEGADEGGEEATLDEILAGHRRGGGRLDSQQQAQLRDHHDQHFQKEEDALNELQLIVKRLGSEIELRKEATSCSIDTSSQNTYEGVGSPRGGKPTYQNPHLTSKFIEHVTSSKDFGKNSPGTAGGKSTFGSMSGQITMEKQRHFFKKNPFVFCCRKRVRPVVNHNSEDSGKAKEERKGDLPPLPLFQRRSPTSAKDNTSTREASFSPQTMLRKGRDPPPPAGLLPGASGISGLTTGLDRSRTKTGPPTTDDPSRRPEAKKRGTPAQQDGGMSIATPLVRPPPAEDNPAQAHPPMMSRRRTTQIFKENQFAADLSSIYPFGKPKLFHKAFEIQLLLFCVYVALYACNYSLVAGESSAPVMSQLLILVPVAIMMVIQGFNVKINSILISVSKLDPGVITEVIERTLDLQNLVTEIRGHLKATMIKHRITLKDLFDVFDANGNGGIRFAEFQAALHQHDLHVSPARARALFRLFDTKRTGELVWQEFVDMMREDHRPGLHPSNSFAHKPWDTADPSRQGDKSSKDNTNNKVKSPIRRFFRPALPKLGALQEFRRGGAGSGHCHPHLSDEESEEIRSPPDSQVLAISGCQQQQDNTGFVNDHNSPKLATVRQVAVKPPPSTGEAGSCPGSLPSSSRGRSISNASQQALLH